MSRPDIRHTDAHDVSQDGNTMDIDSVLQHDLKEVQYSVLQHDLKEVQYAAAVDPATTVLCLACAGSGKSRTLAYRIAHLLATGASPQSIVAFTFTNKAADTIKRRVAHALRAVKQDSTVLGAMYIGTIHAYCQRVLGDMDPIYRQYEVLDENRLPLFLMSRYAQLNLEVFQDKPRCNRSEASFDVITKATDEWMKANRKVLDFKKIAPPELGTFLQCMRDLLQDAQYLDYSLMIRLVVEALKKEKPKALQAISAVRHLMVDEYQDVNSGQECLIRLLKQQAATLFVVGDDDQAIYAWRGADVGHIMKFQERYPDCKAHTLNVNFRSTTPIVQAADHFINAKLGSARIPKAPEAYDNPSPQDCRVLPLFPDREAEAVWVARRIRDLRGTAYQDKRRSKRGLTPADFAILMLSTRTSEGKNARHTAFTQALEALGIPYSLEKGGSPFGRKQVAVLRETFELMCKGNPTHDQVEQFFKETVLPAYPCADFDASVRILSQWGRRIHCPQSSSPEPLYPQELLYDLLDGYNLATMDWADDVMRDIGLFSRMLQDVTTVYTRVDSPQDFASVLNFLQHGTKKYNTATDDLGPRPDTVTVSTIHGVKGLEFPCVFVVDMENPRFPSWVSNKSNKENARLFYTAVTRAERYLYVSGNTKLPDNIKNHKLPGYAQQLAEHEMVASGEDEGLPDLPEAEARQRPEKTDYRTSFSEIQHYLQCPRRYQFQERYGFGPIIQERSGFGQSVHICIQQLHQRYPDSAPNPEQVAQVVADTFHLKHIPASQHPGPFEEARTQAVQIVQNYVQGFGADFTRERQVETAFEIPMQNCTLTGSIDLLLQENARGTILDAEVIDFKTMEGGPSADDNTDLNWTSLALQVQLYAKAAEQVLGQNAKTGNVHFLKDGHRIVVPITSEAIEAAQRNVEWAVQGILNADFPMRPHATKCGQCDFAQLCPQRPQKFKSETEPPPLHLPDGRQQRAHTFSQFEA